ncbi:MAG: ABC transporter substrate-binding protein [Burkholderiaceae bacterium]
MNHRRLKTFILVAGFAPALMSGASWAQSRAETLRFLTAGTVNTLDPTMPGATRESFALSMSTYDRLFAFGKKKVGDNTVFDLDKLRGELVDRYTVSPDGLKITLVLKADAKFQDGSPVTAEDVKWSLDRAVSAKSLAAPQFLTGSLTSPDQFKIVDTKTIEITLPKPDRLALPNLATVYAIIVNSRLAKAHATADDPWAQAWLKEHTASSGAYSVKVFKPGEQTILDRNDAWNRGPDNKGVFFKRLIEQTVPDPATRGNLVERGDADLVIDLQASDVAAMAARKKVKVVSIPQYNSVTYVVFNTKIAPFDNVKVRQAVAHALPYQDMFRGALFGRGAPLFGGDWKDGKPPTAPYPIRQPVKTDLDAARKYLADAGLPNGFSTTFSYNVGQSAIAEPMAALIKESLGKIGIDVAVQKLPDAEMSTLINEKKLPFFTEQLTAWLPSTDYWYRYSYTGDQRWNYSSFRDARLEEIANNARFETDAAKYETAAKELHQIAFRQMPVVPLWTASQDAVMVPSIEGYTYQFHRQVDFRDLSRSH